MNKLKNTILALTAGLLFSACAPVKVLDVIEIKPNETAWAIPLDGSSQAGQVKFNSVGFLDQKKVASKRIMIDKVSRSIGRMYWDIEWIPATRVITVDRSLITKTWSGKTDIGVVTKDSVKLRVGLTVTGSIDEDDASTYLYYHGERSLEKVMDTNILSFAVAELTRKYSELNLADAQTKGTEIYNALFEDAVKAFKSKGITIQYLGNAEGLTYVDEKVQQGINASYAAQQDAKTALAEQDAAKVRNATKVLTATADANAAKELFAAQEAAKFNNSLQIALIEAQARMKMAEKWSGALPANILPSNSPLLLNIGSEGAAPK